MNYEDKLKELQKRWENARPIGSVEPGDYMAVVTKAYISTKKGTQVIVVFENESGKGRLPLFTINLEYVGPKFSGVDFLLSFLIKAKKKLAKMEDLPKVLTELVGLRFAISVVDNKGFTNVYVNRLLDSDPRTEDDIDEDDVDEFEI